MSRSPLELPYTLEQQKLSTIIFYCCALILFSLGLYHLVLMAVKFSRIDSDVTDTWMLWSGYQQYGINFIKTWRYGPDNWLLSLFPWHALIYRFLTFSAKSVVLTGLGIWLGNIILCGLIGFNLGTKKTAFIAPILLLCAGAFVYERGYTFYFISHNITNFFGLLSFLLAILWIKHQRIYFLIMLCFFSIIGGLSDPWFLPCYSLPMLIAVFLMKKKKIMTAQISNLLIIFLIISLLLIETKIFELLNFLPSARYKIANWHELIHSVLFFLKSSGWFILFLPSYTFRSSVVSLIILWVLFYLITIKIKQKTPSTPQLFFFCTIGLSWFILLSSFVLYARSAYLYSLDDYRYFLNLFTLSILFLSAGAEIYWKNFSKITQAVICLAALVYMGCGLITVAPLWKQNPEVNNNHEALRKVLSAQGLTYGYSDYNNSSIITALSNNTIQSRPIGFSEKTGRLYAYNEPQTSPFWYLPGDIPARQKTFFVFIPPENGRVSFYQDALINQFGEPAQILPFQESVILVWSHSLKFDINQKQPWTKHLLLNTVMLLL